MSCFSVNPPSEPTAVTSWTCHIYLVFSWIAKITCDDSWLVGTYIRRQDIDWISGSIDLIYRYTAKGLEFHEAAGCEIQCKFIDLKAIVKFAVKMRDKIIYRFFKREVNTMYKQFCFVLKNNHILTCTFGVFIKKLICLST